MRVCKYKVTNEPVLVYIDSKNHNGILSLNLIRTLEGKYIAAFDDNLEFIEDLEEEETDE